MYRLNGSEDLFDIGWEDYLSRGGVCAVEWSEQVADALPGGHGLCDPHPPSGARRLAEHHRGRRCCTMRILALETSAKAVSAAVTEDGKVLCSGYQDTGLTHSRTLMPIVEAMLKNTGLTVQDCDAVAVAAGPGSFTGIRIGVSAAKGLAFAADKPCAAVSTLEAMARNVAHMDALVVCAMDARRSPDLQRPLHLRTWPPDPPDAGSRHRPCGAGGGAAERAAAPGDRGGRRRPL